MIGYKEPVLVDSIRISVPGDVEPRITIDTGRVTIGLYAHSPKGRTWIDDSTEEQKADFVHTILGRQYGLGNKDFSCYGGAGREVATLEKSPQTDQLPADSLPCYRSVRHSCPAEEFAHAPVCLSIVCACARIGESPYPEAFEIVVKPGETLRYHLVKPNIGQEDLDKETLNPESSSEDKTRTPGQAET